MITKGLSTLPQIFCDVFACIFISVYQCATESDHKTTPPTFQDLKL